MYVLFLERLEEKQKETLVWERNMDWLLPKHTTSRDRTRALGMCPDQESTHGGLVYWVTLPPTEHPGRGLGVVLWANPSLLPPTIHTALRRACVAPQQNVLQSISCLSPCISVPCQNHGALGSGIPGPHLTVPTHFGPWQASEFLLVHLQCLFQILPPSQRNPLTFYRDRELQAGADITLPVKRRNSNSLYKNEHTPQPKMWHGLCHLCS